MKWRPIGEGGARGSAADVHRMTVCEKVRDFCQGEACVFRFPDRARARGSLKYLTCDVFPS